VHPKIISTLDPFQKDPAHPDGVVPVPLNGGEVKQFVHGGSAISLVGAVRRDTPDSVVQDLRTGRKTGITDTPGYTETTIFSPDERLGITMTTRFSPKTDLAVLGLMPRPYPDSLNMSLSIFTYMHSVTAVRRTGNGTIGPALIDIRRSEVEPGYLGVDLGAHSDWVFRSPMSWHPSGTTAMWIEGQAGSGRTRIRVVRLPDYRPGRPKAAEPTPDETADGSDDLSQVAAYARSSQTIDVKVYGRAGGYIRFRRSPGGLIEKDYVGFSDDGKSVYAGSETFKANPSGNSLYTADVRLSGPHPGIMQLQMTFGPLGGPTPARLSFAADASGKPATRGFAEYGGERLSVDTLLP
jgi:hypothetical protein